MNNKPDILAAMVRASKVVSDSDAADNGGYESMM
jgi:hypothetical protein